MTSCMKAPTCTLANEHVPIDDLAADRANPRHISDAELEALTRSVQQFGLVDPLIVRFARRLERGLM